MILSAYAFNFEKAKILSFVKRFSVGKCKILSFGKGLTALDKRFPKALTTHWRNVFIPLPRDPNFKRP